MIMGKATMAIAAMATFFRWLGAERRADELALVGPSRFT